MEENVNSAGGGDRLTRQSSITNCGLATISCVRNITNIDGIVIIGTGIQENASSDIRQALRPISLITNIDNISTSARKRLQFLDEVHATNINRIGSH